MAEVPTYAIIPTNGRPCFADCLKAIGGQVQRIVVIEGGPEAAYLHPEMFDHNFVVAREPELNISKWWNLGLTLIADWAKHRGASKWNVAVLNDDAIAYPPWVQVVGSRMREMGAAAASSGNPNPIPALHTQPGQVNLSTRLQGYAFMLAGEKGVRANETLHWYFSDDHVDWLSRQQGGVLSIPGHTVEHRFPNAQVTPELHEQIAKDAAAFSAYWGGMRPW